MTFVEKQTNARRSRASNNFAVYLKDHLGTPQWTSFFLRKMGGSKLIDLGAGTVRSLKYMAPLLSASDISEYVPVDIRPEYAQPKLIEQAVRGAGFNGAIRPQHKDMLEYLADQEDNSAHICLNGIDFAIIRKGDYRDELIIQIARIVPKEGLAFGMASPHLRELPENFNRINTGSETCYLYEKRE